MQQALLSLLSDASLTRPVPCFHFPHPAPLGVCIIPQLTEPCKLVVEEKEHFVTQKSLLLNTRQLKS